MGKTVPPAGGRRTVVPLRTVQDEVSAAALARDWDSRLQGCPVTRENLDPEICDMLKLPQHSREVAPPVALTGRSAPPGRLAHYGARLMLAALLLFTSSRLLGTATDPDRMPWVPDDWLATSVPAVGSSVFQITAPLTIIEEISHGA